MQIQFLNTRQIDRLMNLQNGTSSHYRKMAGITTEEDLIELFNSLADRHETLKRQLEDQLYSDQDISRDYPKKRSSYLGKIWQRVVIALLVNNRKAMLKYCRQAETKLVQHLPALHEKYVERPAVKKLLEDYDFLLKKNLEAINAVPTVRSSHKKTA
ncbi:MAG: hypothetical protein AB8F74_08695 [Saprospiraceae bacterium]